MSGFEFFPTLFFRKNKFDEPPELQGRCAPYCCMCKARHPEAFETSTIFKKANLTCTDETKLEVKPALVCHHSRTTVLRTTNEAELSGAIMGVPQ